jgi:hypothetical protein
MEQVRTQSHCHNDGCVESGGGVKSAKVFGSSIAAQP